VLRDVGFNFDEGRQDRSVHPFSTGIGEGDVRITTRLREDDLTVILGSTIHEAGHALYDQAMDRKAVGVILAEATSLGIHESQSRLWENLVGLSQPFLEYYLPRLRELFPEQLADVTARELYEAVNVVEPSLIRVEADEVTYNLHVLVRFELELALVEGTLAVADLPGAWNDRYEAYLGVRPSNDAEGCLQDIHWSMGALGYFPTYTLGNLYSVPFFEAAKKDVPGLGTQITPAIMQQLREWLRQQVHRTGRSETAEEISVRITGQPLTPEPFLAYLNAKYSDLYQLG
jgi:carboxypeptidase Taq